MYSVCIQVCVDVQCVYTNEKHVYSVCAVCVCRCTLCVQRVYTDVQRVYDVCMLMYIVCTACVLCTAMTHTVWSSLHSTARATFLTLQSLVVDLDAA